MNKFTEDLKPYIEDIGSALFYSDSTDVLKLPTQIVNTKKVDEAGQIWFMMPRPVQHIEQFHRVFPVSLRYYRKGKSVSLSIEGKAHIVCDPEELSNILSLPDEINDYATAPLMLVCVKILRAALTKREQKSVSIFYHLKTWWSNALSAIHFIKKEKEYPVMA